MRIAFFAGVTALSALLMSTAGLAQASCRQTTDHQADIEVAVQNSDNDLVLKGSHYGLGMAHHCNAATLSD